MDDAPLTRAHGAPVRLVIPEMYGYKNVKWLTRIELVPKLVPGLLGGERLRRRRLGRAAPTATEYVRRFSRAERTAHWVVAVTFLVMTATGLILYLPMFASLAADRMLWKSLHIGAAIAFWAGLFAVVAVSPRRLGAPPRSSIASTTTTGPGSRGPSAGAVPSRRPAASTPARS